MLSQLDYAFHMANLYRDCRGSFITGTCPVCHKNHRALAQRRRSLDVEIERAEKLLARLQLERSTLGGDRG